MNFSDKDEVTILAGEYVLGVLRAEDRHVFDLELQHNTGLVAAVAFWQDRLLEVAPVFAPVEPAANLWKRLERNLPGPVGKAESGSLWSNLFFWRATGMAGLAASAFLALRLVGSMPEPVQSDYLAVLQAPDAGAPWLVEINAKTLRLRPLSPAAVGAENAIEFWTKPEGAAGPTSLGLVPADRPTEIAVSKLPGLGVNQLFEGTLEPKTGSPIGRPTGKILAVGKAVRL